MTEKQLLKYDGKNVCITMHLFPHSVSTKTVRGMLVSEPVLNLAIRNGIIQVKEHFDFYLKALCNKNRTVDFIRWTQVKLIIEVNEL